MGDGVGGTETFIGEAGSTMTEIVTQVRRVAVLIAEIGSATSEQTTGIGQVSEAVSQLDRVTQQNASMVLKSSDQGKSLQQAASELAELVAGLKPSTLDATPETQTDSDAEMASGAEMSGGAGWEDEGWDDGFDTQDFDQDKRAG